MHPDTLDLVSEFAADDKVTPMDAALLVGRCLDDGFDLAGVGRQLDELAAGLGDESTPWAQLRAAGYGGRSPVDVVAGSRIDRLLDEKAGLPITLGVLLVHLCRTAGYEAEGINFPGHFLVRSGSVLIDPFHLLERSEADCLATLPAEEAIEDPFTVADSKSILLRMLNNLKFHYLSRAEFHRALEIVECQCRALPGNPGLRFEQGELWLRLGSIGGARRAFLETARIAAEQRSDAIGELARRRLAALQGRNDTLH